MDELLDTCEEVNRVGADFLKVDLKTALIFVKIARETADDFQKRRNRWAARTAYETVVNLFTKINLTTEDCLVVKHGLDRLKSELETLGETF